MAARYDNILLVAFGGPSDLSCQCGRKGCPGGAYCYVRGIVGDSPSRAERIAEVVRHYETLGGISPFNALTCQQADALHLALKQRGLALPVRIGMRHWKPFIKETLAQINRAHERRTLVIIMAPHRSKVSWEWYQQSVSRAIGEVGGEPPRASSRDRASRQGFNRAARTHKTGTGATPDRNGLSADYVDPWYQGSGYIEAITDRIRQTPRGHAVDRIDADRFQRAALIFTAHAIPTSVAEDGLYASQFAATAEAVAGRLGEPHGGKARYATAYQSASTGAAWTGPDINDVIRAAAQQGAREVVVAPIGFLCDHIEVLYDLDVEARQTAAACGVEFHRASTVGSHPAFIGMLADLVCDRVAAS